MKYKTRPTRFPLTYLDRTFAYALDAAGMTAHGLWHNGKKKATMSNYVEVIRAKEVRAAQKEYDCMASDFVRNCIYGMDFLSFTEKRQFIAAREIGFKIRVGDPYIHQFNKFDGMLYTFRAIPAMHDICTKYDLYKV